MSPQAEGMTMRRIAVRSSAALAVALIAPAGADGAQGGIRSGAFALTSQGTRAMGMGGAMTGLADDASSNFWNPAGVVNCGKGDLVAGHAMLYGIPALNSQYLAYAIGDPVRGGYGASFSRLAAIIGREDTQGTPADWGEQQFHLSAARTIYDKGLRLIAGVGARILTASSDLAGGKGSGWAGDAGLLAQVSKEFAAGARVRNALANLKWDGKLQEKVPAEWAVGLSYRATKGLVLAADVENNEDNPLHAVRGGGEIWVHDESKGPLFRQLRNAALRAGVVANLAGGGTAIAAGATVRLESAAMVFGIDYAFLYDREGLGSSHRIGISARR